MKSNSGLHIGEGLIIRVALSYDNTLQTHWISNIPIGVFLNDDFDVLNQGHLLG